jgi:hypothetical protein
LARKIGRFPPRGAFSQGFAGTVAGLALGNDLDLADISFGVSTTLGYTPNASNTGGTLNVSDGTHS